jgi:hypothetical protein
MKLRKITKMQTINDGTRSLVESIMMPEIIVALRDWSRSTQAGVLIGSLGSSFHCKPRFTEDIDFLVLEWIGIPERVRGFTRTTPDSLRHDRTQAEVNLLTPSSINVPIKAAEQVVRFYGTERYHRYCCHFLLPSSAWVKTYDANVSRFTRLVRVG